MAEKDPVKLGNGGEDAEDSDAIPSEADDLTSGLVDGKAGTSGVNSYTDEKDEKAGTDEIAELTVSKALAASAEVPLSGPIALEKLISIVYGDTRIEGNADDNALELALKFYLEYLEFKKNGKIIPKLNKGIKGIKTSSSDDVMLVSAATHIQAFYLNERKGGFDIQLIVSLIKLIQLILAESEILEPLLKCNYYLELNQFFLVENFKMEGVTFADFIKIIIEIEDLIKSNLVETSATGNNDENELSKLESKPESKPFFEFSIRQAIVYLSQKCVPDSENLDLQSFLNANKRFPILKKFAHMVGRTDMNLVDEIEMIDDLIRQSGLESVNEATELIIDVIKIEFVNIKGAKSLPAVISQMVQCIDIIKIAPENFKQLVRSNVIELSLLLKIAEKHKNKPIDFELLLDDALEYEKTRNSAGLENIKLTKRSIEIALRNVGKKSFRQVREEEEAAVVEMPVILEIGLIEEKPDLSVILQNKMNDLNVLLKRTLEFIKKERTHDGFIIALRGELEKNKEFLNEYLSSFEFFLTLLVQLKDDKNLTEEKVVNGSTREYFSQSFNGRKGKKNAKDSNEELNQLFGLISDFVKLKSNKADVASVVSSDKLEQFIQNITELLDSLSKFINEFLSLALLPRSVKPSNVKSFSSLIFNKAKVKGESDFIEVLTDIASATDNFGRCVSLDDLFAKTKGNVDRLMQIFDTFNTEVFGTLGLNIKLYDILCADSENGISYVPSVRIESGKKDHTVLGRIESYFRKKAEAEEAKRIAKLPVTETVVDLAGFDLREVEPEGVVAAVVGQASSAVINDGVQEELLQLGSAESHLSPIDEDDENDKDNVIRKLKERVAELEALLEAATKGKERKYEQDPDWDLTIRQLFVKQNALKAAKLTAKPADDLKMAELTVKPVANSNVAKPADAKVEDDAPFNELIIEYADYGVFIDFMSRESFNEGFELLKTNILALQNFSEEEFLKVEKYLNNIILAIKSHCSELADAWKKSDSEEVDIDEFKDELNLFIKNLLFEIMPSKMKYSVHSHRLKDHYRNIGPKNAGSELIIKFISSRHQKFVKTENGLSKRQCVFIDKNGKEIEFMTLDVDCLTTIPDTREFLEPDKKYAIHDFYMRSVPRNCVYVKLLSSTDVDHPAKLDSEKFFAVAFFNKVGKEIGTGIVPRNAIYAMNA
ncbi:MAG: hypothetical protein WC806_03495 [Candidatus Gracilibacteria bacterium]|jgi:hypothetical protein